MGKCWKWKSWKEYFEYWISTTMGEYRKNNSSSTWTRSPTDVMRGTSRRWLRKNHFSIASSKRSTRLSTCELRTEYRMSSCIMKSASWGAATEDWGRSWTSRIWRIITNTGGFLFDSHRNIHILIWIFWANVCIIVNLNNSRNGKFIYIKLHVWRSSSSSFVSSPSLWRNPFTIIRKVTSSTWLHLTTPIKSPNTGKIQTTYQSSSSTNPQVNSLLSQMAKAKLSYQKWINGPISTGVFLESELLIVKNTLPCAKRKESLSTPLLG